MNPYSLSQRDRVKLIILGIPRDKKDIDNVPSCLSPFEKLTTKIIPSQMNDIFVWVDLGYITLENETALLLQQYNQYPVGHNISIEFRLTQSFIDKWMFDRL